MTPVSLVILVIFIVLAMALANIIPEKVVIAIMIAELSDEEKTLVNDFEKLIKSRECTTSGWSFGKVTKCSLSIGHGGLTDRQAEILEMKFMNIIGSVDDSNFFYNEVVIELRWEFKP